MQGVLKDNNLKFALAPIEVLYHNYFIIIRNKMEINNIILNTFKNNYNSKVNCS